MRILVFFSAFFALAQANFAQVTVPSNVNTSFSNTYPGAQAINWTLDNGNYRGEFMTADKTRTSVIYDANGQLTQSEVDIRDTDLPLTTRESWGDRKASRYTRITDANGVVTYSTTFEDRRTYDAQGKEMPMPNKKEKGN